MSGFKVGLMGAFLLLLLAVNSPAKSWRGVTPLKSTRADVEQLLGKPNDLGRYEIENDRAYIVYSEGECVSDYRNLMQEKCECLVAKDTVLRIAVTLKSAAKFEGIDKRRFTRTPLASNTSMSAYSNLDMGVVYTVVDSAGTVTAVDFWPSAADCQQIIQKNKNSVQPNVWRGIRALYSTRNDVERILGKPTRQALNEAYAYISNDERIEVLYSDGPCTPSVVGKGDVLKDTVLRVMLYPQRTVLLQELGLDLDKFRRGPDPNIPDSFFWVNREEGVMIQSQVKHGAEQIVSIEYSRSSEDRGLLCKQ